MTTKINHDVFPASAKLRDRPKTQFPHPISYRFRVVESSIQDLEGYKNILECAENITFYIACLAILMTKHIENFKIGYLKTISERIGNNPKQGTNFGDWYAILDEVACSKEIKKIPESEIIFPEVIYFLRNPDIKEILLKLKEKRDDDSHGRGPKGEISIRQKFIEALDELETLLFHSQFLTSYPLLYIENTRSNSIQKKLFYDFRYFMSDHPLSPILNDSLSYINQTMPEIDAKAYYIKVNDNKLILLSPLLNRLQCPECHKWSTFYLDKFDSKTGECILKGIDNDEKHSIKDSSLTEGFKYFGLIN